jgi:hypothetical protein
MHNDSLEQPESAKQEEKIVLAITPADPTPTTDNDHFFRKLFTATSLALLAIVVFAVSPIFDLPGKIFGSACLAAGSSYFVYFVLKSAFDDIDKTKKI